MKKWIKIVLIIAIVLIGLVLAAAAIVGIKTCSVMSSMHSDAPAFTTKPTADQNATASPQIDEGLTILEEEPSAESFEEDVADTADDVYTETPIYLVQQKDADVINIIIFGLDSQHYAEYSPRSDVMLLLSYNRADKTVKLLSFLRDSYVPVEGHRYDRLNTAYHFGGIGLAINTINETFDLDIQNYVTLAFSEFETLVDAIGGIDLSYEDGTVAHFNGEEALAFVRNRKFGEGDFGRTARQRRFMQALYQKVRNELSLQMLLELANFATDYIRTNLSTKELINLAMELYSAGTLQVETGRMPFDGTWHYAHVPVTGASVVAIDLDENARLVNEFLYGEGE